MPLEAEAVKQQAYRLGFELVGITTPEPPLHLDVYQRWIAEKQHGEMGYLGTQRAIERRGDPRRILAECQSILVLGMRYPTPADNCSTDKLRGSLAAYAWGDDYHDVLPERMRSLVHELERLSGGPIPHRIYSDSGPLLERELAQRAGLGWIGKNTCLIHPHMGSYFLLSEILLGIKLQPDAAFIADRCGSCQRCFDACPTGCILPNRTLDARRCISYLTIELKSAIPQELRPLLGNWIFGCDVCQQVCPWNQRFAQPAASPESNPVFSPRLHVIHPELLSELRLTPEGFNQKFKGSPVKRAKRRGYLRSVAVALGNSGNQQAIPSMTHILESETEPLIRGHAAWALGRIGGRDARLALHAAAGQEKDETVQNEIFRAIDTAAENG
jgi:epoxyqueuosine reductase